MVNKSNAVNFSVLKTVEQIDATIAELNDYKALMLHEILTENWRKEVDGKMESFLHFCEEGHNTVYLFIPNETVAARQSVDLNGLRGYYLPLDTELTTETIVDKEGDVVCMVSVDA